MLNLGFVGGDRLKVTRSRTSQYNGEHFYFWSLLNFALAELGGARPARAPLQVQILSF